MCVEQSSNLACVVLISLGLVFGHLLSEAISEGRANVALHCFELLFETFGVGGTVLFLGLLEFEPVVPVCQNGDRWVLSSCVLMDTGLDGCQESQLVIPNSGLIVWDGNQSVLQSTCAVVFVFVF